MRRARNKHANYLIDRAAAFESGLEAMRLATSIDNEPSDIAARGDRVEALADDDAARVHCTLARSNAHKTRGEFAAVVDLAQRALPLARHDARLQALVHSELGSGLAMLDRHAEALPHMQGALAWLDVHGSAMDRGVAHGELAIALDNSGRLDEALAHHQGAYELLRHLDDIPLLGSVCGNLACNRIDAGDLDAADEALVRGQQWLATSEEQQAQAPILQLLRALVLGGLQRYGDALTQVQLALDTTRRYQPAYLPRAQLREAQLWALLGQWGRVHQALQAVAPVLADAGWPPRLMHAVLQRQAARVGLGQADAGWQAMAQLRDEIGPHIRPDLRLPLRIRFPDGGGIAFPRWPAPLDALAGIATARGWHGRDKLALLLQALRWRLDGFQCDAALSVADEHAATDNTAPTVTVAPLRKPVPVIVTGVAALFTPARGVTDAIDSPTGLRSGASVMSATSPKSLLMSTARGTQYPVSALHSSSAPHTSGTLLQLSGF